MTTTITTDEAMGNAMAVAQRLARDADLRGLSGYELVEAFAGALSARDPELCGKVLAAIDQVLQQYPIVKIIGAGTITVDPHAECPRERECELCEPPCKADDGPAD